MERHHPLSQVRLFGGDAKEWDEFSVKLKGRIASGNTKVADIVDFMEAKVAEGKLEEKDYSAIVNEAGCDEDEVVEMDTSCTTCC